jgi:hypothetical protein
VPYPLLQPLTLQDLAAFIEKDILVTFTAKVPLREVARAGDHFTLAEYIEEMWMGGRAVLTSPEYRAVGATFDDFGEQFAGYVHLQVTCQLSTPPEA